MQPIIALLALTAFLWLANYSLTPVVSSQPGYSADEVMAMNDLAESTRPLKERQADALKDLYGLDDRDTTQPVTLWRN